MGGDVMKRIMLAILLTFAALTASTATVWADSSDSTISTTEAP
jgi:hypothetical protein